MSESLKLKELITKRGSIRGRVTKFKSTLDSLALVESISKLEVDKLALKLSKIETLFVEFDEVQNLIEVSNEEAQSSELVTRDLIENDFYHCIATAQNLISKHSKVEDNENQSQNKSSVATCHHHDQSCNALGFKLPVIKIPNFDGTYFKWLEFKETFVSLVHNNNKIENIHKYHYLQSYLEGEAARVIANLEVSHNNYSEAWKLLCERYDNKRQLINNHLKSLFNFNSIQENDKSLRYVIDHVTKNLRALNSLGLPTDKWDVLIIYFIAGKLSSSSYFKWEEHINSLSDIPSLKDFFSFLKRRADVLETVYRHKHDPQDSKQKQICSNQNKHNSSKSLVVAVPNDSNTSPKTPECLFCKNSHRLYECPSFKSIPLEEKTVFVSSNKLCENCLRPGHAVRRCRLSATCRHCKLRHNTLLHKSENSENSSLVNSVSMSSMSSSEVLLCTARVKVTNPATNDTMIVRALLDSGSQSTIITQAVKRHLNLIPQPSDITIVGIGNTKLNINTERCILRIHSETSSFNVTVSCLVLPQITGNLPKSKFDLKQLNIHGFQLADPTLNEPSPINLLIGADLFWDIISAQQHSLGHGFPKLQASKFGWLVTGPLPCFNKNKTESVMCNFVSKDTSSSLHDDLSKFWELENFPQKRPPSSEEKLCEQHYLANTTRTNIGQFCVGLPLRDNIDCLGDSYCLAKKRFFNLEARFRKQPDLKQKYCQFIDEYEALGHLSESPESRPLNAYFLPHHPVIREQSESTKLRVVFDASARTTSGVSVNNLQMVGPVVQDPLFNILVRFRQHKYVLTGDIEKMFRSVLLRESDRNLQLILWRDSEDKPLRTLRLNTVTYGFASASFLTTRSLWQLGEECSDQKVKVIIQSDLYCDDLLTGASSEEELRHILLSVSSELEKGCFHLRKYRSNLSELLADSVDLESGNLMISNATSTLGIGWTPSSDEFHFQYNVSASENVTKRSILSSTFKIFDPLGLLSLFTIKPKILLQELWSHKIDWDEPVPPEVRTSWLKFSSKSACLSSLKIPRRILIDNASSVQIHCFCDASQRAFGSCIYLRSISASGVVQVSLVCAKSRVAPIKPTTIPRLELCAALLGAQLTATVVAALRCPIERQVYWSDSKVVLGWLNSNKTKTFVAHRVAAIHELTNPSDWRYVPTSVNPADLVSRGVEPDQADLSIWWNGPSFLAESEDSWPAYTTDSIELPELKTHHTLGGGDASSMPDLSVHLAKFSNLTTLIRVLARVLRFVKNCRSNRLRGPLEVSELESAHNVAIKLAQKDSFPIELEQLGKGKCLNHKAALTSLNPFLDENGIIRVGGRIVSSSYQYDKRHPILLHASHFFTKLIFKQEHLRLLHAGPQHLLASIRERYWPVGGRALARRAARECVICRRFNAHTMDNIMGNLPADRVEADFPFSTVGTDFAGPFLITDRKGRGCKITKSYLCIFICFRYKCVHLELVSDLSMEAFLLTLKRFIARRGKPKVIYCDNGRNFVAAAKDINSFLESSSDSIKDSASREGIEFRFSPAYAPHFGGLWEAGVKSAKFHLYRVLKNIHLTFEELSSLFAQIEAILNSRPLCPLSPSPQDLSPLTPGHFIIGRPLTSLPSPYLLDYSTNRLDRFQRLEQARQHFWKRWSTEYVTELQQRTKWKVRCQELKVDDLVLIKDDRTPPLCWRLGRVSKLFPGTDGVPRVADVFTSQGTIRRAINRLCLLRSPDDCTA
nr:uncharacterized protein LOC126054500 [Helicoverpa armigera]